MRVCVAGPAKPCRKFIVRFRGRRTEVAEARPSSTQEVIQDEVPYGNGGLRGRGRGAGGRGHGAPRGAAQEARRQEGGGQEGPQARVRHARRGQRDPALDGAHAASPAWASSSRTSSTCTSPTAARSTRSTRLRVDSHVRGHRERDHAAERARRPDRRRRPATAATPAARSARPTGWATATGGSRACSRPRSRRPTASSTWATPSASRSRARPPTRSRSARPRHGPANPMTVSVTLFVDATSNKADRRPLGRGLDALAHRVHPGLRAPGRHGRQPGAPGVLEHPAIAPRVRHCAARWRAGTRHGSITS